MAWLACVGLTVIRPTTQARAIMQRGRQVQQHSRTGNARADTTIALGNQRKQQNWVLTLEPRMKSGGKARRIEYVAWPVVRRGMSFTDAVL